jgi:hypothetical protein
MNPSYHEGARYFTQRNQGYLLELAGISEVNCAHHCGGDVCSWMQWFPNAGQEKLMDRIRFVIHRGRRILLVDFTGCSDEEVAAMADRVPEVVTREPVGSLLVLGDFSDAEFTRDAVERIKVASALDRPHIKRAAWVLTENLPKALYDSIRSFSAREIPVFATRAEAMDYLVSDPSNTSQ